MSFSANHKSKKKSLNYLLSENLINKAQKISNYKRESSKKDTSRLSLLNNNHKFFPNYLSNSSVNTNISVIKDDSPYTNYPNKKIVADNLEDSFIRKRKKIYKPPSVINNKIISFQKQKNKEILYFSLFDENLIFKDINRSYLQDEYSDDGSESSDEKIDVAQNFLSQELEDSIIQLSNSFKKNQNDGLLSRRMKFKH